MLALAVSSAVVPVFGALLVLLLVMAAAILVGGWKGQVRQEGAPVIAVEVRSTRRQIDVGSLRRFEERLLRTQTQRQGEPPEVTWHPGSARRTVSNSQPSRGLLGEANACERPDS